MAATSYLSASGTGTQPEQMNTDANPAGMNAEVVAVTAPVLQLLYAHYYLSRPKTGRSTPRPDWLERLNVREPALVAELASLKNPEGRHNFFEIACQLDYWNDPGAARFLQDLPELPDMMLEQLSSADAAAGQPGFRDWLLTRRTDAAEWADQFRRLHSALAEEWLSTGRRTVQSHREQFMNRYLEQSDVIKALPPYHFIRFEKTAESIRLAEGQQQIVAVPLYFAAAGGFSLASGGRQFVGFGLRSGDLFEDTRARIMRDARSIKALSDPTRLLLLTLIARYSGFSLTVGDLAQYLAVSQPTVSGHLKILRDSGLVDVERQGNRSFYRPDTAAIRALLRDMDDTLLPH